jgi:hypothetical protein
MTITVLRTVCGGIFRVGRGGAVEGRRHASSMRALVGKFFRRSVMPSNGD